MKERAKPSSVFIFATALQLMLFFAASSAIADDAANKNSAETPPGLWNNIYCARPNDPNGISVTLDADSKWIVPETSYITGLTLAKGATLTAPEGYMVTMTVDGVRKKIKTGTYTGQIVLAVSK